MFVCYGLFATLFCFALPRKSANMLADLFVVPCVVPHETVGTRHRQWPGRARFNM